MKYQGEYFRRKEQLNRVVLPIFVCFTILCLVAGFTGYLVQYLKGDEHFVHLTKHGWVPVSSVVLILGVIMALGIACGLKGLMTKRKKRPSNH